MICDVVVVGGGSAGCVVAGTLAASGASVVLLEAGGDDIDAPDLQDASVLPIGPGSTRVDAFSTELMPGRATGVARGRVLGGSGAVNGGYFLRARRRDADAWPQDLWSGPTVQHYHDRVEERIPLHRSIESSMGTAFVEASAAAGYGLVLDTDGVDGCLALPSNVVGGRRVTTAHAFLHPVRASVDVRQHSRVSRILMTGGRATGVDGIDADGSFTVHAGSVVLTAGAAWTPALLMHSGIGDPVMLQRNRIDTRVDLPGVGAGTSDHPEIAVPYTPKAGVQLTGSRALDAVLHVGDLELRPYTRSFDTMIPGLPTSDPIVGVALMAPESRGRVVLTSSDPFDPPRIEYHYLESTRDRRQLEDGVRLARHLLASTELVDLAPPAPLADRLGTSVHLCSSARMGTDAESVVDARCAVHGVDALFVMDSSMFPVVPSRGPHASVVMAALRAAELFTSN